MRHRLNLFVLALLALTWLPINGASLLSRPAPSGFVGQGFPVPLPQRLFDTNGSPANGWKIYTYVAGTSTPLTTYSDATLSSMNTNPIVADSSGYFRAFVAEAVLIKLEVKNASDVLQFTFDNLEPMPDTTASSGSVTAVPTGGIIAWTTNSAPTGFLICDGSAVSRATYTTLDTLFSAAGYPYGNGNGTTTFNLPDLRQRFPLGKAASGTGNTLAGTGGAIDHTHTGPSHTHDSIITRDGWGATLNSPSVDGRLNTGAAAGAGQFSSSYQPTADLTITSAAGGTGNTGTANSPFLVVQYVIKY